MKDMPDLTSRLRALLGKRVDIAEKRMIGGIGFMHNGNILVGAVRGALLVRVGAERESEALKRKGASVMKMGERVMEGYVAVSESGLDDAALDDWIAYAEAFVKGLPPK